MDALSVLGLVSLGQMEGWFVSKVEGERTQYHSDARYIIMCMHLYIRIYMYVHGGEHLGTQKQIHTHPHTCINACMQN